MITVCRPRWNFCLLAAPALAFSLSSSMMARKDAGIRLGLAVVSHAGAWDTGFMVADVSYLCSVTMVQAWSRAGLRVMCSPLTPVTSTVSPFRARSASSSCNDSGLVSSESFQTCCGSHVMSSMLMFCPFLPRLWQVIGGTWLVPITLLWRDCGSGCVLAGAVRPSMTDGCEPSVMEGTRFLPRFTWYAFFIQAVVHACGGCGSAVVAEFPLQELVRVDIHLLYGCFGREGGHTVRQWFGVVEVVPGVRFGHLPCVGGAVRGHGFENHHGYILSRHVHGEHSGDSANQVPIVFVVAGWRCRLYPCRFRASFPMSDEFRSSGMGGACFLPRFAWYARFVWSAGHMVRAVVCMVACFVPMC